MLQFTCPCGKALHARDEYAGQTTRCPGCGRDLVIPADQGVQGEAPPPPRDGPDDGPPRRRRPRIGDDDWYDQSRRSRRPGTSGMAIGSAILGVLSLFLCSLITGIPAIILGAIGLRAIGQSEGRLQGKGFAITGLVTGILSLLLAPVLAFLLVMPAYHMVTEAASRQQASNNLMQIDMALIDYSDENAGELPPPAICSPDGKPLLSWRVAILPYIEQENLYTQFHLDEPWDSPNNIRLLPQMPKTYLLPGATAQPGYTYFRVFVGDHAAFTPLPPPGPGFPNPPHGTRYPAAFVDGTSNTILVAEAADAVPWTKPDAELAYSAAAPLPPLGGHYSSGFVVGLADGRYRLVPKNVSQQTLRAAITRDGNDVLGPDW
jgi:hypothetical protein